MPEHAVSDGFIPGSGPRAGESQAELRERMTVLQAEALERRQKQLGEQRSPLNSPADRIRIWERLHQLTMPRSPSHRLIAVIAANTGLSLEEVRLEQRERATAKAAAPTTG